MPATQQQSAALLDYLRDRQAAMTELLLHLVRLESPSSVPEAQVQMLTELNWALRERGMRTRLIRGEHTGGHLLAVPESRRRGAPRQLLIGHCDTVWPLGTIDSMPAEIREGRLHGPGVFDMKAGLVHILFALEAVQVNGFEAEVEPIVFVNSDEEIGSPESTRFVERLARIVNRVFVLEPSLGPSGKLKTARKGVGRFRIRISGRAAHAGLDPEKGASAILELSHTIQRLAAMNDPARGITINVGMIEGGVRPNVVAPESRAVVDVRVLHREDADRVEREILDLKAVTPGTTITVEGRIGRAPLEKTPRNRALWGRAEAAAAELGIEIEEGTAGGGSDGNTTSRYAATLDGLGAVGDGAHAPTEHIVLERMPERVALLARLLLDPPLD